MSAYGHGPTARETAIIERSERGEEPGAIAAEMGLSEGYVRQVVLALVAPPQGNWQAAARDGSTNLLKAIRRYHAGRLGGAA